MRTLGLIGGTSWESTAEYYRIINQFVARKRGGLASAKLILYSLDFEEVRTLADARRVGELQTLFTGAVRSLERAGAEAIVICSNTGHVGSDAMMSAFSLPLLHIGDAIGEAVADAGVVRVGLIGTRQTMELGFMRDRIAADRGITIVTPGEDDRERLDQIIFGELSQGKLLDRSRREVIAMMNRLRNEGAAGVVLGCTELPLLIRPRDVPYLTFDTTELHALACARWSLHEEATG